MCGCGGEQPIIISMHEIALTYSSNQTRLTFISSEGMRGEGVERYQNFVIRVIYHSIYANIPLQETIPLLQILPRRSITIYNFWLLIY